MKCLKFLFYSLSEFKRWQSGIAPFGSAKQSTAMSFYFEVCNNQHLSKGRNLKILKEGNFTKISGKKYESCFIARGRYFGLEGAENDWKFKLELLKYLSWKFVIILTNYN